MLHVKHMIECNRSKGKFYDVKRGLMNDRLRGCLVVLVQGEDC